jgi:signal transduction histidine kinase
LRSIKLPSLLYRVPEHQHSAKRTGLGLAFVQSIVQDMHIGHITVGIGSKFSMRIPLGPHDSKRPKKTEN